MATDEETRKDRLTAAGDWLRAQREEKGWSGTAFAQRLGIGQVRVSSYERGQYEVPEELTKKIAEVFEMPMVDVRRELGFWVPADADLEELRHSSDLSQMPDEKLLTELVKRAREKTTPEILDVYSRRSEVPDTVWQRLIGSARKEITLAGYTNYFFWTQQSGFDSTLKAKLRAGTKVRVLLGDPDSEVTRHREQVENAPMSLSSRINMTLDALKDFASEPNLEVRFSERNAEAHALRSVFQFDREALVCESIGNDLGHNWLTFHLKKLGDDGPFERYTQHLEILWDGARPWTDTQA